MPLKGGSLFIIHPITYLSSVLCIVFTFGYYPVLTMSLPSKHTDISTDESAIKHVDLVHLEDIKVIDDPETLVESDENEAFSWDRDVILNLVALNMVYFASSWGLVVPSSVIGFIARVFPSQTVDSPWIAAAVSIPNCVLQAFLGDLSDILDRRWFLLVGALSGVCGSLVAARGTDLKMVIAGQVLNGFGVTLGFLAIPLSAETVPKKNRPVISAISMVVAGVATVIGPLVEGFFIKDNVGGVSDGWRCSFYLGAGFYAIAFVLTFWLYHPRDRPNPEQLPKLRRILKIDWLGVFLISAGLLLLLVGLHYGGNLNPWGSAKVLAPLILGIFFLILLGIWEWKGTTEGIVRHDLFGHRNFHTSLIAVFTSGMVFFGGQAYIPQEVLYLMTSDAVMTSVWVYPYNIATIIGAASSGLFMAYTKEAKGLMVGSFAGLMLGSGLMAVVHPGINFAGWFFPTAIMGFAVGIQLSIGIVVVGLCTPDRFIGTSLSIAGAVRGLGGSIGITIFGQIYSSKLNNFLPTRIANVLNGSAVSENAVPSVFEAIAAGSSEALLAIPGMTVELADRINNAAAYAYADSFRFIWYTLIPFAFISMVVACFLKSTKSQMTSVVAASVKRRHA
jgi:MFS family permease